MEQQNGSMEKKAVTGAVWKFAERILAQVITLAVSLVIARLLNPSDYGVVSLVTAFFAFANVIISGGLNTALIQKKNADREDYNTVFTVSLLVAFLIYLLIYLLAPWIAHIYDQPVLVPIMRVLGLSLPIYALKSIVCAYVSANLQFKMFFFATLSGTLVSAAVGVYMALNGFGAWALVAQQLTNTAIDTLVLFCITKIKLSFHIATARLRSLLSYGSRIMLSSLLGVTVTQINPLFIGLKYTSADLSFYTKGRSLPDTLSSSMVYTISSVLFPVLSKVQDDREKILNYTRRYMQVASFVTFPVMFGFMAVSENFIRVFLTEKWLPAAYYIQIACVALAFDVVAAGNCETIKAMGRSDIFLKIEIAKKTGYFITLALFLMFTNSPEMLALSMLACTLIQVSINSIPNVKLIGYKPVYQIADLLPNLLSAAVMCAGVILIGKLNASPLLVLVIQILAGVGIYILMGVITQNKAMQYLLDMIKRRKTANA